MFLPFDWPPVASQAILSLLTTPLYSPPCHALDLFPPGFKNLSRAIRFQTDSSSSKLLHTVHSKETAQSNSLFACTNLAKEPFDFHLDMVPPGPHVYLRWTPAIGSRAGYSLSENKHRHMKLPRLLFIVYQWQADIHWTRTRLLELWEMAWVLDVFTVR